MRGNRKYLLVAAVIGFLSACAHKPPRVDCEGHLESINRPAAMEGRKPSESPESAASPKIESVEQQGAAQSSAVDHSATPTPGSLPERAP